MRILIIDQCSGTKDYPDGDESHEYSAEEIDGASREELLSRADYSAPAHRLYDGRQQNGIDEAVRTLRAAGHEVDRYFVSAGFGLVEEREELPAYNVYFNTNTYAEKRGEQLHLPQDVRDAVRAKGYDVAFFPLGSKYYTALDLPRTLSMIPDDVLVVVFNSDDEVEMKANVTSLTANEETGRRERIGGGSIGVKAEYLKHFATNVSNGDSPTTIEEVRTACHPSTRQVSFDSIDEQ